MLGRQSPTRSRSYRPLSHYGGRTRRNNMTKERKSKDKYEYCCGTQYLDKAQKHKLYVSAHSTYPKLF